MARPQKDGMDYFPHDTDASSDEKIEPLIVLYGAKGYAFYFYLLERIYRQKDFELLVSDAETIQLLTRKLQITEQEFGSILKTALRHGAFDKEAYDERQVLTSNGIKKRASVVVTKRESMREREFLRQKPSSNIAETMEEIPKVKESKVNKNKIYTTDFESFMSVYPKQDEKSRAFTNWQSRMREKVDPQDLIVAAKNYAKKVAGKEQQFIKLASNFIGREKMYLDYVGPAQTIEVTLDPYHPESEKQKRIAESIEAARIENEKAKQRWGLV